MLICVFDYKKQIINKLNIDLIIK